MPTVQDVANKFEKFDPEQKALELLEFEEDLAKNTVHMPPRVKRKMEWKKKRMLNDGTVSHEEKESENGWIEEENDENELPQKKKQKKSVKIKESKKEVEESSPKKDSKKLKNAKKQRMSLPTTAEENAKSLIKDWIKKGKELEKELPSPKAKKVVQKDEKEEFSTPKAKSLVLNPFAAASTSKKKQPREKLKGKGLLISQMTTPTNNKQTNNTFDSSEKRVKIALNRNMVQEKHEYIEAVKNSPVPYDSSKKPTKGLLKPNLLPSPINPFYRRRIGLKFNDTL